MLVGLRGFHWVSECFIEFWWVSEGGGFSWVKWDFVAAKGLDGIWWSGGFTGVWNSREL